MKATELMIGDWVNYSTLNIDAKVVSILGNHTIAIQFVDKGGTISCIHGIIEEAIHPIPLTSDILVKNGFEKSNRAGTYELNTDYYEIEVWDYSDGLWVVKVQYLEFSSLPYSQATVSYLHQFQHALRLCGIEEEITI